MVVPTATTRSASRQAAMVFGRNPVALGVHDVILDSRGRDGPEGGQTDGEIEAVHGRPPLPAAGQHVIGQVETGGRGGDRAGSLGVDRLVTLWIGERFVDIWGQGHRPALGEQVRRLSQQPDPPPAPR